MLWAISLLIFTAGWDAIHCCVASDWVPAGFVCLIDAVFEPLAQPRSAASSIEAKGFTENVVDLMDALRRSVDTGRAPKRQRASKKTGRAARHRKAS